MSQYWLNKKGLLLFLILILALFLRVYLSLDDFLHTWDERFHALVAKNLLDDPLKPLLYKNPVFPYNAKDWFANHIWLHKQPLPLWLMSLSIKCFGSDEFVIRIPSIVLSTLSVYFTYAIGQKIFSNKIGLIAAFFHATNGLIIEMCAGRVATDHYDTLFLVFIEGAIYFVLIQAEQKKNFYSILIGAFIGFAILTKWLPALVVLPVWFLFSKKQFSNKTLLFQALIIIGVTIIIALPWQIYILKTFPVEAKLSYRHNLQHVTETLDEQGGSVLYFLDKIRVNYSDIIYLPLAFFVAMMFTKKRRNAKNAGLLIWIFIPICFFSIIPTKMQGYILFVSPALFIVCAYYIHCLQYKFKITKQKGIKILIGAVLLAAFVLPIRYLTERMKLFEEYNRSPQWSSNYKVIAEETNGSKEKLIFINVKHPIEFMFYPGYSFVRLDDLQNQE